MKTIANILVKTLIFLLTAYIVPGFNINSFVTALLVVVVLGVLNIFLKPLLILLTLPINILTLGLFTFVVNAFLLYFASLIVSGFKLESFWSAVVGALVIALLSAVFSAVFKV